MTANASTYYMSPTGSNTNAGTFASPWANFEKVNSVVVAGDTVWVRGGTYRRTDNNLSVFWWLTDKHGTASKYIYIAAYPSDYAAGSKPVFNMDNIAPTQDRPYGIAFSRCSFIHIKGITVKNLKQKAVGGNGLSTGFSRGMFLYQSPDCIVELMEIFNIGGGGFGIESSSNTYVKNCDVHHCGDGLPSASSAWNGGDCYNPGTGGDRSTNITFDGCRGYLTGDDIWDAFAWNGDRMTFINCWAAWASVKPVINIEYTYIRIYRNTLLAPIAMAQTIDHKIGSQSDRHFFWCRS